MATQFAPSVPTKRLANAILSTDMSFVLSDIVSWDKINNLTTADFPTSPRGVFRSPDNTQIEFFTWDPTTVANGSITITARGLDYKGGTTGNVKPSYNWPANSTLVELGSNPPAEQEDYVDKISDETIGGLKTFLQTPLGLNPGAVADASLTNTGITRLSASTSNVIGNPTISIASPAVITLTSHGMTAGDEVKFTTTGALPTGLTVGTTYYVISTGLTTNTFEVSLSLNGTAINTSGTQSGTHTLTQITPIAVGVSDPKLPTTGEAQALAGNDTSIAVGSGNKFVTQTGLQRQAENYAATTGSANAYLASFTPAFSSLTVGQRFNLIANFTNTGAATFNPNSIGASAITKNGTNPLVSGDIVSGQTFQLMWDGTEYQLMTPANNVGVFTPMSQTITALADSTHVTAIVANCSYAGTSSSNSIYTIQTGGGALFIYRYDYDITSGIYIYSGYNTNPASFGVTSFATVLGSYLYVSTGATSTNNYLLYRFNLDLTGITTMTVSGTAPTNSQLEWQIVSDGTYLYINAGASTSWYKYSVSGTTATYISTITYTSFAVALPAWSDGTYLYQIGTNATITKWTLATGGSSLSTKAMGGLIGSFATPSVIGYNSNKALAIATFNAFGTAYSMILTPITKF